VKALDRKLLRDMSRMKGQALAVSLVMACGLAMMIMARSLSLSLTTTQTDYYQRFRFADLFASLKRAPLGLSESLKNISGVGEVELRVAVDVTLDLPGLSEPASGRITSLPEFGEEKLNRVFLREGRRPEGVDRREVIVGEAFAKAHGLHPGDTIGAIINGRKDLLRIVGIGLSPEFVFEARPGETLPDNKRFGVFWMNYKEIAVAYNLDGAFNDVAIDLVPGTNQKEAIEKVDALLQRYGCLGAYGRDEHASARRLEDELHELDTLSIAYPIVFLSVASFLVNAIIARLVRLQREQIAQLKAFGYSALRIGFHYLQFGLAFVCLGTIFGAIAGAWLGQAVTQVYTRFFLFPELRFQLDWSATLWAALVCTGATVIGVWNVIQQAMRLPPAEAMRPEAPAEFRPAILERMRLTQWFSASWRMALRNIERKPFHSFFTFLGLALATGILIVPSAIRHGIDHILTTEWSVAQRMDATVSLIEPGDFRAYTAISHLPGVLAAEPFRTVPAEVRFGYRSRRLSIQGLLPERRLLHVLDRHGTPLEVPANGLLISRKLAEILGATVGDRLEIQIEQLRRPRFSIQIAALVEDFAGLNAYISLASLRTLMREGDTVSGAHLLLDKEYIDNFYSALKETPRTAGVVVKDALRQSFEATTAESIGILQTLYTIFAGIVAFGVVYNSSRIALSERSHELATLRVVGFTQREVSLVLIGELALITMVAIPFGFWVGAGLTAAIFKMVDTETIRLPLILTSQAFGQAALTILLSAAVSFWSVGRRIRHLDLIGVLKARD
jgi:putative ABC transport system permease protein